MPAETTQTYTITPTIRSVFSANNQKKDNKSKAKSGKTSKK